MKQKSLLLTSAMLMMSAVSFAGIWQTPTITGQAPVTDGETEQYLYNVDAKAFFLGANDWNTRASVSATKGYKVKLTSTGEGTYSITDYVQTQNAWKKTFVDAPTGIWVDNNNGANADTWTLDVNGTTFTIGNTAFPDLTLGAWEKVNGSVDTRLYMGEIDGCEGAFWNTWTSVSTEEYDSFIAIASKAEAGIALEEAIAAALAKYPNLDLADEQAICNNPESTLEELQNAKKSVENKVKAADAAAAEASATPENPMDLTSLIVNQGFDKTGDFTGWSGTAFGAGGTTGPCAEHYQKTFDSWQLVSGLPKGVYMLKMDGFYRAGSTEESYINWRKGAQRNVSMYAVNLVEEDNTNAANDTVSALIYNNFDGIEPNNDLGISGATSYTDPETADTYYVPNTMASAVEYMKLGYYNDNQVMFAATNGQAKIGVKNNSTLGWTIVDNFRIVYYGNSAASYQFWMDQYVATAPADLYDYVEYVTGSYVEAYKTAITSHTTASTYEEVMANLAAVKAAQAEVEANIAAWKQLLAVVAKCQEITGSGDLWGDAIDELADYVDLELTDILDAKELTTEEILALAEELEAKRQYAIENCLKPGSDFTTNLVNPDFGTGDWTGWTHNAASGGNVAVNASAKCAEAWNNADFDIFQEVKGAPVGVYSISMQGFYREGRGENAWRLYFDGETGEVLDNRPQSTAFVYMNDAKTPLANVFDYQVVNGELYTTTGDLAPYVDPLGEYWYPNDMVAAGQAFDMGAYQVAAYGLVAKKGDVMRVGVKGRSNNLGDSWAIFDNFKLTFEGFKVEIIQPLLEEQLNSQLLDALMGADIIDEVAAAKAAGQQALASGDGRAMFDALAALYALDAKVEASVALFETMINKWNELADVIGNYSTTASAATVEEANALYTRVETAIAQKTFTDAEATQAIEDMNIAIAQLKIPGAAESATDEAPVDLTSLLATPSFQNEDMMNSVEGWQNTTGYNFGNDDTQKSALCLEFYEKKFDMYQDIVGLPAGTYAVKMQGFYRYTNAVEDYARLKAGEHGLAFLYAKAGEADAIEAPVSLISADPSDIKLESGSENELALEDGTVVYIPNDMVSAAAYFDAGHYNNGVIVKVGEDGKLRIGVKETETVSGGWMIMDNWTLTYYGANSTKEEGSLAISEVAAESHVVKSEIFSLNGMKAAGLQKGINIVRTTMSNGDVIVRKISIK